MFVGDENHVWERIPKDSKVVMGLESVNYGFVGVGRITIRRARLLLFMEDDPQEPFSLSLLEGCDDGLRSSI